MPKIAATSHFTQLRDWSERKHAILQAYLPVFCQALSKHTRGEPIWYIDGFAGAGIYRGSNSSADTNAYGSPLLAARIAQELPYIIRCLNVEGDNDNFDSLQQETNGFSHVENIKADFNDVIDEVLHKVAKAPALFFLDPFGMKDLPMEGLVDRIVLRTRPTDILLRYATETVRRLVGAYEKDSKRRDAHARNLDKWFRGQEWRTLIGRYNGAERDEALIGYYLQQLVSISDCRLRFSCAYPIRSNDGITKYHLVFATANRLGMKLMSDILFKEDTKYDEDYTAYQKQREMERRGGQISLFDLLEPEPSQAPNLMLPDKIAELKNSIILQGELLKTQWEYDDLFCTLIENGWFARFLDKDFRVACKQLYAEGKIKRISPGKAWSRGTEFIICPRS